MATIVFIRYLHCVLLVCKWYVFVIIKHWYTKKIAFCVYFCLSFFTKNHRTFANKNEKQIDMARNRNILLTLTIESPIVLVAAMAAFRLHELVAMPSEISVLILVAIYACIKVISILCSPILKKFASSECSAMQIQTASITTAHNDTEIQKQRMELFHQEYLTCTEIGWQF